MNNTRAYTWFIVTYAKEEEFEPLLLAAKHWAYAHHDKDFIIEDDGNIKPKEPHTHIIVTFERAMSFKQVREMVESEQNTLAQPCESKDRAGRDVVRGMFKYLTHEDENPETKFIYDKTHRRTDNDAYWQRRIGEELTTMEGTDFFMDDLIAEEFSVIDMGRKYGRDFMKNYGRYCEFRTAALHELNVQRVQTELEEFCNLCHDLGIPLEEVPKIKITFREFLKNYYNTKGK